MKAISFVIYALTLCVSPIALPQSMHKPVGAAIAAL